MNLIRINPETKNPAAVDRVIECINAGKIVAHPTETVYGLAADAYNEAALDRIFDIKKRDYTRPLSVMVSNIASIKEMIGAVDRKYEELMKKFLPGPVTFILPVNKKITNPYFRQFTKIGFRIPDHKFTLELLKKIKIPLVTTSANRSGLKNPQLAIEVLTNFGKEVDLVIDGGKTKDDIASTVVDLSEKKLTLLREGQIKKSKFTSTLKAIR